MASKCCLYRPMVHFHPCPDLSLVKTGNISPKMFDQWKLSRGKMHIFSTISFTLVIFIFILASTLLSHNSVHSISRQEMQNPEAREPVESIKLMENVEDIDEKDHGNSEPPFNLTVEERISWFKSKGEFDGRIREFLDNHGCPVQFFMTWISPAESFGPREILAAESVFKAHPKGCLIILSKTLDSKKGRLILNPFLDYGYRILAVTPDLSFLFKKTPAESWFEEIKTGKKDPGEIPLPQNLSNLIRLAVLYKYGGIYLDTDFIVLKDFSMLKNSIGAQSIDSNGKWTRLNNAVLVFDKNHPLLFMFLEEFKSTFDGNRWGHNGPYLVSRVISRVDITQEFNFTVLPPMAFYPFDWTRIDGFFHRPNNRAYSKWIEAKLRQINGETYGVHLWNRQSAKSRIQEGSIIGRLISDHCIFCQDIYSS
ncbi:hypothetical protein M9H77_22885 [Catharanthus roseus]|uniref:Uncharacterized protein n=1 Tax=Catharanthus roseus TaxID=4058 RepID=A0ACC0ASZ4_CATRO|nr:hypothetical protein M9H77_22885 [Catharanthus roseus]